MPRKRLETRTSPERHTRAAHLLRSETLAHTARNAFGRVIDAIRRQLVPTAVHQPRRP